MLRLPSLFICLVTCLLGLTACTSTKHETPQLSSKSTNEFTKEFEDVVNSYFNTYQQRTDFKSFMSYYHEQAQFEDIIYGNHLKNKADITAFLNWQRGEFALINSDKLLTITKQVIDKQTVVTQGYFHQFSYDEVVLGPWLFVMVHEFDSQLKIIKQTDWINYTPRENFLGGINMNKVLIR